MLFAFAALSAQRRIGPFCPESRTHQILPHPCKKVIGITHIIASKCPWDINAIWAGLTITAAGTRYFHDFAFYFGPNKYSILKKIGEPGGADIYLERLVPLGWGIFGWVNRWCVIPVFDFLRNYIGSFGIIIFILVLLVKLVISPLTYKSYVSMAKMRLVKPQIDELAKKYPKPEDAMKKQQATMELYKKAGINPMGGCIPMLIQMPILIAMFRFFPASIELREHH